MPLASVKCPPAIWWTPDDDGSGIKRGWARRWGRRAAEAAVLERGGASADRRRGSDARRVGCRGGAGEWRQREPGLQMDPPFAGRLAGSALRCGRRGAGGDKLVAGGERNPRDLFRSALSRSSGGRRRLTPAEMEGGPGLRHDPPSATRLGAMEVRLPNGAQVRIEEGVDGEVLRLVLSTLSGL